jgi:hypothetical protein
MLVIQGLPSSVAIRRNTRPVTTGGDDCCVDMWADIARYRSTANRSSSAAADRRQHQGEQSQKSRRNTRSKITSHQQFSSSKHHDAISTQASAKSKTGSKRVQAPRSCPNRRSSTTTTSPRRRSTSSTRGISSLLRCYYN